MNKKSLELSKNHNHFTILKKRTFTYLIPTIDLMLKKTLIAIIALFVFTTSHAQNWETLNNKVLTFLGNGDYANALLVAKEAKTQALTEFGEDNADYSASLHNLASAHKKLGEYTVAESYYWEALKIDKKVLGVKHQNYALSLFGLANLYKLKKDFPKSESIYLDALDIMERAVTDRHPDYSLILSDYADLQTELKNFDKSENNLRKAKDITKYSVGENHQDYAGVLFHFGKLYKSKGNIEKAETALNRSLEVYKSTVGENHPDYKDCKRYIDNLYNPAYQLYVPAASEVELAQKVEIERPALNVSPTSSTVVEAPKVEIEKPMVNESAAKGSTTEMPKVEIEQPSVAIETPKVEMEKPMTNVETPKVEMEKPVVQEMPKEEPKVVPPPAPKPKTWNDYSIMMDRQTQKGDYLAAIESGEKAMTMVKNEFGDGHENYTWISLKLADSYENAGLLEKAIPLYEKDLMHIESTIGKENMTYKKRRDELLAAYEKTGQKNKAHQFYKNSLYASLTKFNNSSILDQNRMMENMQTEIETYYVNSMSLGIMVSGKEMQNLNLAFKGRGTDAALGINSSMLGEIETYQQQLRDKLKSNEASIDFLRLSDQKTNIGNYYAIITRKSQGESHLVPLLDESKINSLINAAPDSPDSYIQNADRSYQLYQLIWEPLEEHLKGVNFVHVSTVGTLNKVALSGLMDHQKNSLADKYDIYYYSSLRDFINDKNNVNKNESVNFFGGADFGGGLSGKLNYIPATRDEVNTFKVVCAAKGWAVNTNTGADATEENLKALSGENAPGVLHIATPIAYQHLEEYSSIALTNANDKITASQFSDDSNDGLLNAKEISKLDLSKTNLVLLSTTETGSDKNSDKGILSIQRALKAAGVDTILFSQWRLPDKQVQEMLALFYINHLSGMDTHKAFYTAQNDIRRLYPSPYYWAGFILIE